jgi:cytoskeletal protein RodZ
MNDFGGKLRQAREQRGLSLRQVAASTKISMAALEALERNDVSKMPGGVFSRGMVRSYAAEIGLNPDKVVDEFLQRFETEAVAAPPAGWASQEEIAFEARKKLAARVFLLAMLVMLVISSVLVYYLLRNRPV